MKLLSFGTQDNLFLWRELIWDKCLVPTRLLDEFTDFHMPNIFLLDVRIIITIPYICQVDVRFGLYVSLCNLVVVSVSYCSPTWIRTTNDLVNSEPRYRCAIGDRTNSCFYISRSHCPI